MTVEVLSSAPAQDFPGDWYDASDPSHFWFRWRLAALRPVLSAARARVDAPLAALDVGCGTGVLAAQLEAATAWTVDGTDLDMAALERSWPRRGRALFYDVRDERPELLGRYDVVVVFDVLEHLPDPRALLRSALRHLAPGGLLLVNVPALPALASAFDRAVGHLRRYTRRTLRAELDGLGLEERALRYWGMALVPVLAARKLLVRRVGPRTIERGIRPPAPWVNDAFVGLMRLETAVVREPWLGASLLYAGSLRRPL